MKALRAAFLAALFLSTPLPAYAQAVEVVPYLDEGVLVHKTVWPDGSVTFTCPERPGRMCPVPASEPVADVPTLIVQAAGRWGVSAQRMLRIAWCESRLNPGAVSPWGDRGTFQFNKVTWEEQAPRHGLPRDFGAAFDPALNVELAAALLAKGQGYRWACK